MRTTTKHMKKTRGELFELDSFPDELQRCIENERCPASTDRADGTPESSPALSLRRSVRRNCHWIRKYVKFQPIARWQRAFRNQPSSTSLVVVIRRMSLTHAGVGSVVVLLFCCWGVPVALGSCYLLGILSLAGYLEIELQREFRSCSVKMDSQHDVSWPSQDPPPLNALTVVKQ